MRFPDRETVDRVKSMYPPGSRVVLDWMDDYMAPESGTQGTVICVDDVGAVIPVWDATGGRLSVVYGYDKCHLISTEEEAKTTLDWYGKHQPEENARCPRCGALMRGKTARQALSRWADIMVCPPCGYLESLEAAGIIDKIPLMQWTAITEPMEGGGEWKG